MKQCATNTRLAGIACTGRCHGSAEYSVAAASGWLPGDAVVNDKVDWDHGATAPISLHLNQITAIMNMDVEATDSIVLDRHSDELLELAMKHGQFDIPFASDRPRSVSALMPPKPEPFPVAPFFSGIGAESQSAVLALKNLGSCALTVVLDDTEKTLPMGHTFLIGPLPGERLLSTTVARERLTTKPIGMPVALVEMFYE